MATILNQEAFNNLSSTRHRPSLHNEVLQTLSKNTQRDTLTEQENMKKPKSKTNHIVLEQLKIDDLKENSLLKSITKTKEQSNSLPSNKELLTPSPFNNLSNVKLHHLDPLDIHSTKNQSIDHNFVRKQSSQNSPKLSKKEREVCEKLYEQKLNNLPETKRKSISHRIHITASKEKENNSKKINQDKIALYNDSRAILKFTNEFKETGKPEFPEVEEHILPSLVSSKEKSSHSFMIRKKIASSSLQGQKQERNVKKPLTFPTNYRKDRFTKEDDDDFISESKELKPEKENVEQKFESNQTTVQIKEKNEILKVEKEDNEELNKIIQKGKSLKVRKGRYSKAEELALEKEGFGEKEKKEGSDKKSKFRSTIEDYLEMKKIHEIETKAAAQIAKNKRENNIKSEKNQEILIEESMKIETLENNNEQYEKVEEKLIEKERNSLIPFNETPKENIFKSNDEKLLTSSQVKVFRKRVSSIRALKNCFKNFHTEEQSEFLTDSRLAEPTKRKEKEPACLTHKIKWGTHSRKKSISEKGIELANNLNSEVAIEEKRSFKKIDGETEIKKLDLINENKESPAKEKKEKKQLRFSDELEEIDIDSPYKNGILKVMSKKESSITIERPENTNEVQTIGSRSLIVFDDPGISIIVRKDSSAQSSDLQPGYNTIDNNLQDDDNDNSNSKRYSKHKQIDSVKLESLRELFIELKSHKSIHIPDEKEASELNSPTKERL